MRGYDREEEKKYLLNLIEKSKKDDIDAQKELYEYLKTISAPIAYSLKSLAEKSGLSREDFDASVYDAMYNIIFKNDLKNVKNFESYFKTSYKYSLIARIRDNVHFYKNFQVGLDEEKAQTRHATTSERTFGLAKLPPESSIELVVSVLYDAKRFFTRKEYSVLMMLVEGFSIPEIIRALHSTKYKIYTIYQEAITKLKEFINSLFPTVVE